jgi:NagD protein
MSGNNSTENTRDVAASFAASLEKPNNNLNQHIVIPNEDTLSARDLALLRDPVLHTERLDLIRKKKGFIIDMDGVIYHVNYGSTIYFKSLLTFKG